jgi:hypothetical protein
MTLCPPRPGTTGFQSWLDAEDLAGGVLAAGGLVRRANTPPVAKYDDVLMPFLALMRKELHANCGKGDRPGWLAMDANAALLEVYYHLAKLQKAVRNNDGPGIQEYSADVANMAMMVLDICGGLALVDIAQVPEAACGESSSE